MTIARLKFSPNVAPAASGWRPLPGVARALILGPHEPPPSAGRRGVPRRPVARPRRGPGARRRRPGARRARARVAHSRRRPRAHAALAARADRHHATSLGLKVAWTYRTGDARPDGRSQIQCNPIVVDGVLYATSAGLHAFRARRRHRARAVALRSRGQRPARRRARRQSRRRLLERGPTSAASSTAPARRCSRSTPRTGRPLAGFGRGRTRRSRRGARPRPRRSLRAGDDARRRLPATC